MYKFVVVGLAVAGLISGDVYANEACKSDLNSDGQVSFADFLIFAANYDKPAYGCSSESEEVKKLLNEIEEQKKDTERLVRFYSWLVQIHYGYDDLCFQYYGYDFDTMAMRCATAVPKSWANEIGSNYVRIQWSDYSTRYYDRINLYMNGRLLGFYSYTNQRGDNIGITNKSEKAIRLVESRKSHANFEVIGLEADTTYKFRLETEQGPHKSKDTQGSEFQIKTDSLDR